MLLTVVNILARRKGGGENNIYILRKPISNVSQPREAEGPKAAINKYIEAAAQFPVCTNSDPEEHRLLTKTARSAV